MAQQRRLWWAAASAVAVLALGAWAAGPAPADIPYTLTLSAPQTATVGTAFVMTASGTEPIDQGALYLDVYEIPASVVTTCPSGYLQAGQLAGSTGNDVAFYDRETPDGSGNFSMPVAFTPSKAETELFCAYTDDEATDTLAGPASALVTISAPSAGGGSGGGSGGGGGNPAPKVTKPVNTGKPKVTRSGRTLSCSRGSWTESPGHFAYDWLKKGKAVKGAHRSKLSVTPALRGHKVQCSVTASNIAGSASARSAQFAVH